jgi:hypothetical protein
VPLLGRRRSESTSKTSHSTEYGAQNTPTITTPTFSPRTRHHTRLNVRTQRMTAKRALACRLLHINQAHAQSVALGQYEKATDARVLNSSSDRRRRAVARTIRPCPQHVPASRDRWRRTRGRRKPQLNGVFFYTAGGIRTPTPLQAADFESAMSTVPSPRRGRSKSMRSFRQVWATSLVSSSINAGDATTTPEGSRPSGSSVRTANPARSQITVPAAMSQALTPRS